MNDRSATLESPSTTPKVSLGRLLLIFFKVGSIGFGGGMAIISIMEYEFVRKRRLLSLDEFLNGVGFGQILGSFAVNVSLFVGYRLFGVLGGILSAVAFLFPSIALVIALSHLYFRFHAIPALQGAVAGLSPVVIALIVEAGWSIGRRVLRSPVAFAVGALALGSGVLKINALWILLGAGAVGLIMARSRPGPHEPANDKPKQPLVMTALAPVLAAGSLLGTVAGTFLKVGFVFFGGGFLLIPVLHNRLVTDLHWLSAREFIDGVAISNLTPGPIAVLATFTGYHLAGIAGALVATVALMTPAAVLMLAISRQYERFRHDDRAQRLLSGLNPAIAGLILSTAILLSRGVFTSWQRWLFGGACLLILRRFHWPPVILLGIGAIAGYAGLLP
jgi:chromate transporter